MLRLSEATLEVGRGLSYVAVLDSRSSRNAMVFQALVSSVLIALRSVRSYPCALFNTAGNDSEHQQSRPWSGGPERTAFIGDRQPCNTVSKS